LIIKKYYTSKSPFSSDITSRVFTREEVGKHNTLESGWIIIEKNVYNVTKWLDYHPGGKKVLIPVLGKDASFEFKTMNHSPNAYEVLSQFLIGRVTEKKRYTAIEDNNEVKERMDDLY